MIKDPQLAYDIVQHLYTTARNIGAKLFGFGNRINVMMYDEFKPIHLTGFINGCALGLVENSGLEFIPETVAVEDYYISAMNAYLNRYCYIDSRFQTRQIETFKNAGGQSEYRNLDTEYEDTLLLKRYFGDSIRLKTNSKHYKRVHKFERTLSLPF